MMNLVAEVRALLSKCMSPYFENSPTEVSENHKIKVHALSNIIRYLLKSCYGNLFIEINV